MEGFRLTSMLRRTGALSAMGSRCFFRRSAQKRLSNRSILQERLALCRRTSHHHQHKHLPSARCMPSS